MATDNILITAKTILITFILNIAGTYTGAFFIAFFASMLRLFYDHTPWNDNEDKVSYLTKFYRYFGLCLPLTLGMVHVGLLLEWNNQQVIVASGIIAAMARETITLCIRIIPSIIEQKLRRYYDN